jgi:hypothetical protein
MLKLLRLLVLLPALLSTLATGVARVVDPAARADPLLDLLTADLEARGVDVRRGTLSSADFLAERPQLTRLANFPLAESQFGSEGFAFQRFFNAGAFTESALVAVGRAPAVAAGDNNAFEQAWKAAPKEQRIFISFSGQDLAHAQRVAAALQARGYATFIYRNEAGNLKYNAVEVGRFFAEAGEHLVLDTSNARKSVAVKAEARAFLALQRGIPPPAFFGRPATPPAPSPQPAQPTQQSQPCCKLCTYRNGIQIGCGPTECGPQCIGAR